MIKIDHAIPKLTLMNAEGTPSTPPKIDNRLQQIFLLSIWSLTNGLAIGTNRCLDSMPFIKVAPIALLINWVAFPFNPLNADHDRGVTNIDKITRIAIISIFHLIGIVTPFLFFSYISPSNRTQNSTAIKVCLLAVQLASITTNLIACKAMHSSVYSKSGATNGRPFKKANQTCALFLRKLSIWVPKFNSTTILNSINSRLKALGSKQADQENGEKIDLIEIMRKQTPLLIEQNKYSAWMDRRLRKFISEDKELSQLFLKSLLATKHILLPSPILHEPPPLNNPTVAEWAIENKTSLYWSNMSEWVRCFLQANPKFAQLLCDKFYASNIKDKEEIIRHYKLMIHRA